jgi:hypothetical protein
VTCSAGLSDAEETTDGTKEALERTWTQSKGKIAKEEDEDGSKEKLENMNDAAVERKSV